MRHRVAGRKLGRTSSHRRAMFANMAASLVKHDRIETTLMKAKELRSLADRIVTLSKNGSVAARRRALVLIRDKKAVKKAFDTLRERFAEREGGYTRIMKLGRRHGDNAPMALIEYVEAGKPAGKAEPKKTPTEKKTAKKAAPRKAASKPKAAAKKKTAAKKEKKA